MPINIIVPPLSQTLDTLVLVEWLKKVGETVQKGEPLFAVETDKATLDVESPASGVLESVSAQPGDEVHIHGVIGYIREDGESTSPEEFDTAATLALDEQAAPDPKPGEQPVSSDLYSLQERRIFASPRARQLISKKGLKLEDLDGSGTGPQGMIVERDVRAFLEQSKPRLTPVAQRMAREAGLDPASFQPAHPGERIRKADVKASLVREARPVLRPEEASQAAGQPQVEESPISNRKPLSNIRKTIAARMTGSHLNSAPVTYLRDVDATRLVKLRRRILKEIDEHETRPTLTDFLIRLTCLVLRRHPDFNATFDDSILEVSESVNLALAVDTERGLVVPVIPDAGTLKLAEIAHARSLAVEKALRGDLKPEEMSGGTFTISNLGPLGIDHFTPIINPPQVAILGVGQVREQPAFRKGKLRRCYVMGLSVTCDHRIIDGAPAARFLLDLCRLIEEPALAGL